MPFTPHPTLAASPSAVLTARSALTAAIAARNSVPTAANQAAAVKARDALVQQLAQYRAGQLAGIDAEIKSAIESV